MKRRQALVASGSVVAALSGCLGLTSSSNSSPSDPNRRTIVVSATGEVDGEPDLAILNVAVEATADEATTARDDLAERSEAVIDALVEYGIAEEDITTEHYRISERIDRQQMEQDGVRPDNPEQAEEYTYYEGTHALTIDIHDIDTVGEVVDVAIDAGADEVGRITFTLSEETRQELTDQALEKALQNAHSKADTIATEVGASIVEPTTVDATGRQISPIQRDLPIAEDGAQSTPAPGGSASTGVEVGDVTVTAEVQVQYEME